MLEGRSGTGPTTAFDADAFDVQVTAEVKNFVPEDLMDRRTARRSGRHTQMAVVAAREAVATADLVGRRRQPRHIGVIIASSRRHSARSPSRSRSSRAGRRPRRPADGAARRPVQRRRPRRPAARSARAQLQRQQRLRLRWRRHRPGPEPAAAGPGRLHDRRRRRGDD